MVLIFEHKKKAKEYAEAALQINHKLRQAATLLAIIYSLENGTVNAEKRQKSKMLLVFSL